MKQRELKFRLWTGEKMLENIGLHPFLTCRLDEMGLLTNGEDEYTEGENLLASANYGKIMQFTGHRDRNNNEIYEGDIVKFRGGKKPKNQERGFTTSTVVFDRGMFTVEKNTSIFHDWAVLPSSEVIGNIYENKNILDGQH